MARTSRLGNVIRFTLRRAMVLDVLTTFTLPRYS
jgi:hypothetical protein